MKVLSFLMCLLIGVCCVSCVMDASIIEKMIKKKQQVVSVNIFDNEGDLCNEYSIDIKLTQGRKFSLRKADIRLSGDKITLYSLGDYYCPGVFKVKKKGILSSEERSYFDFIFLEMFLGFPIRTVDDIIINYDKIEDLLIRISISNREGVKSWNSQDLKNYAGYFENDKYLIKMFIFDKRKQKKY